MSSTRASLKDIGVLGEDRLVAEVQPPRLRARVACLVEAWETVEERPTRGPCQAENEARGVAAPSFAAAACARGSGAGLNDASESGSPAHAAALEETGCQRQSTAPSSTAARSPSAPRCAALRAEARAPSRLSRLTRISPPPRAHRCGPPCGRPGPRSRRPSGGTPRPCGPDSDVGRDRLVLVERALDRDGGVERRGRDLKAAK